MLIARTFWCAVLLGLSGLITYNLLVDGAQSSFAEIAGPFFAVLFLVAGLVAMFGTEDYGYSRSYSSSYTISATLPGEIREPRYPPPVRDRYEYVPETIAVREESTGLYKPVIIEFIASAPKEEEPDDIDKVRDIYNA